MKRVQKIIFDLKKRSVQRYLNQASEMKRKLEEGFLAVADIPPKLEGSRILLLMVGTPQCLYAALFALHLAHQFKADMYVLHKEILAPLVLEEAAELQVNIPFARTIDIVQLDEIEQIVEENAIALIVVSGSIPNAQRLLTCISAPILFTRHSNILRDNTKTQRLYEKREF